MALKNNGKGLKMKKILVVCMGNICRSPAGEAVLRAKAKQLGLEVEIDSAGTIGYHQGNLPDARSREAGERRGYSFKGIRSRQVELADFAYFDLILAADRANVSDLNEICPEPYQDKIKLYLSYGQSEHQEIPDPYYGGEQGFELVLDLLEEAAEQILQQ